MSYVYAQPQYQVQPQMIPTQMVPNQMIPTQMAQNQMIPTQMATNQMIPTQMPQMAYASALPTNSIKYVNQTVAPQTILPTNYAQTNIMTSSPRTYAQPAYGQNIQMSNQVMASALQGPMTSQVVMSGAGCPPPVQGQPIVIEGAVMGAQSYVEPVKQTVLLQGAQVRPELSQVMRGESRFEYVPYEQVVTEYDQLEKRIRIPLNRYITEYQVIDHQIEYIPEVTYQTQTDYAPMQRVEEEVQYSTQEKRIEHGIKQEMRTSQIIEGQALATTSIAQQPIAQYSQQVVRSSFTPATAYATQQTYAAPMYAGQANMTNYVAQAPMATYAAQAPMATYANQTFVPQTQASYGAQIPGGQWPGTWTNYGKRKSS